MASYSRTYTGVSDIYNVCEADDVCARSLAYVADEVESICVHGVLCRFSYWMEMIARMPPIFEWDNGGLSKSQENTQPLISQNGSGGRNSGRSAKLIVTFPEESFPFHE